MANEDELIAQYSAITGASATESRQYLDAFGWNLELAIADHYERQQDSDNDNDADYQDDEQSDEPGNPTPQVPGGGYRLGDGPSTSQPVSATPSSSKSKSKSAPRKKFATLGDVSSAPANDESDSDHDQDLYAGGDKSGLAIQNPDKKGSEDLKKKILDKARKTGKEIQDEEKPRQSHFVGSARTLGGDDTPSEVIQGDAPKRSAERLKRILHFWADGFSVDDGDLYRFDDPANARILQDIRSGRAPLAIMNVQPGQEVDVSVIPHDGQNYIKPKPAYKPFAGQGQRLGSPTPGISGSSTMPGSFTTDAPVVSSAPAQPPASQVDESRPTITLRVSLGSGTRLTSRFNTDQTIGDVYDFVRRAETGGRSFILQTTFPIKEFTDQTQVLGDIPEFKRGGAIVQKYT